MRPPAGCSHWLNWSVRVKRLLRRWVSCGYIDAKRGRWCASVAGGSSAHEAKKKTARRASGIENFIMKIVG